MVPIVRPGTTWWHIKLLCCIYSESIGSPLVHNPDILVARNKPSLEKFAPEGKKDGLILYDAVIGNFKSKANVKALAVPAVKIAKDAGAEKTASIVTLGVMMQMEITRLPAKLFNQAIEQTFAAKPKFIPINKNILEQAAKWAKGNIRF